MTKKQYNNVLEEALEELRRRYNTKKKITALIAFAKDFENGMLQQAKETGQSWEMIKYEMEQDLREFQMKQFTDPEASACYNKVLILLKDWDGKD